MNFHAPLHPISDPLVFYRVSRIRLRYWLPDVHVRYWQDPTVFREVGEIVTGNSAGLDAAHWR